VNEEPIYFLEQPTHTDEVDADVRLSETDSSSLDLLYIMRDKIFAVIIEPIQINNAVNTPSKIFMQKLKETCERASIALIYDEVQTGFGWLGKMTAAERLGAWPNLLALSKAITAGYGPLSALVSDRKYQDIKDGSGAKTNGADIRSLVASNAVMDRLLGLQESEIPQVIDGELREELKIGLLSRFNEKQSKLLERLNDVKESMKGLVGRIKGDGLIRGIEILDTQGKYDPETTEKIQADLLSNGVLVRHNKHTLLLKVPIVIKEDELEKGFTIVKKVMKKYIVKTI
jgi:4-aminobutyrate aminotransferase-like enzyme